MATARESSTPGEFVRRSALDDPARPVGRRWLGTWTGALFGMYGAYYAVAQIVLPNQASAVAGAAKVSLVSLATGVQAIVIVVVTFTVGLYSDRTLAARGRRQIWVLAGAICMAIALLGQGFTHEWVGVVIMYALVGVGYGGMTAALLACVPDEVPVAQRAYVSGYFGIAQAAGPLVCIAAVTLAVTSVLPGFVLLGALVAASALPFALGTRGTPLRADERQPLSVSAVLRGTLAPLRHTDFAFAWAGRFFIGLSNALAQVFLLYYLADDVHYPDPDTGTLILVVIYTVAVVVVCVPVGKLSDRSMKRKRMVWISSVLQGIAGLILAFLPHFGFAIVAAAVLGVGYGAYIAVDQALITQVLPRAADRGKDLGVINVANVLPYVITGLIGGVVINHFGYATLYLLVLITALIAAATVVPIKSVR